MAANATATATVNVGRTQHSRTRVCRILPVSESGTRGRSPFQPDQREAPAPAAAADGAENSAWFDLSLDTRVSYEDVRMILLNWAR